MCSISVCSFKLISFMVWKLWPEQKFKVKSWSFQKSRADNFRSQTAIKILRPRCTTKTWRFIVVSKDSDGNCWRSCAHKNANGRTDGLTDDRGCNIIRPFGRIKSYDRLKHSGERSRAILALFFIMLP